MHDPAADDIKHLHEHYARGQEVDRLSGPLGAVEFIRTQEIIGRHLPPPPAVIGDVGGGPGRYTLWLADLGYTVVHRDLVPLHVQQLQATAAERGLGIDTAVGDARHLDLADRSLDALLLLGPLYHLTARTDRLDALAEANRVLRPGGPIFVAAVSRWAPRLHGMVAERLYERYPAMRDEASRLERTGRMPPLFPGSFAGYAHRPRQLRAEITQAGFEMLDLVAVEGLAFALSDLADRLANPVHRDVVLGAARATERVPELLGLGPHLLATARRP